MGSTSRVGRREVFACLIVFAFIATAVTVFVAKTAFPRGTDDLDEVAYESQANAIGHHEFTLPASAFVPSFRPFLSGVRDDRVVFKYQPEWPVLISTSSGVFGTTLPLRALLAIGGMLATAWFAWELVRDPRVAVLAGALVVASPFTWVQTASVLGYQLSFVLGVATAAALVRVSGASSLRSGLVAGALLGLAVLHRPFDALLAATPVLVYSAWRARRDRAIVRRGVAVALGGLPFAIAFLAYNRFVMGGVLRLAYNVSGSADRFGFGWRSSFDTPGTAHAYQLHYTVARAWSTLGHLFAVLPRFVAVAPVLAVLAGVALWRGRRDSRAVLLAAMIVVVIAGYFFWWGVANSYGFHLDRSLGPFYYYPLLAPLCVLGAWGAVLVPWSRAVVGLALVVALCWGSVATVVVLHDAENAGHGRRVELDRLAAPAGSLLLTPPQFTGDPYLRVATDAALRRPVLVALDDPAQRFDLVDRFPGRAVFVLRAFRRFDDLFGVAYHDRRALYVVSGPRPTARVRVTLSPGQSGTVYLRVGAAAPRFFVPGTGHFAVAVPIDAALLDSAGVSTDIAIGVSVAPKGGAARRTLEGSWFECDFEARRRGAGQVEMLPMCDGRHHYAFPNGATATIVEDLTPALQIDLATEVP